MLKAVTNLAEMKKYILNFTSLVGLINNSSLIESDGLIGMQHLTNYASLLKFKINNDLTKKLRVDSCSGMISFGHILDLIAEKNNLELKLENSFTLEEIRSKFIKEIDSLDQEEDFDTSKIMGSFANRCYLSVLEKAGFSEMVNLNASLLETGSLSDLIRIIISGYCQPLSSVGSCEIDLYADKNKLKNKVKIDDQANVFLSEYLRNKFIDLFGVKSNMIYEFIGKEKGLEPRRVRRTIFSPFYNKFFKPDEMVNNIANDIDPHYLDIYRDILPEKDTYILSVHTDTSTKHFNAIYETEESKAEKPNITMEHKYFCIDGGVARQLQKYVPKEEIFSPKTQLKQGKEK